MIPPVLNESVPSTTGSPIIETFRILIADDHDLICAGLEKIISAQPDMEVCATATNGTEALAKAMALKPDVAVLDVNMGGLTGLECARLIRRDLPGCEVMLFTGMETDDLIREAFVIGAKSYILKTDARPHLLTAIRCVAQHKPYFTSKVSEVIFSRLLRRKPEPAAESAAGATGRLTAHELEIVRRLALGDSNRELADKLGVNLRTAEGHRAAVMKKMGFDSLADLVRYAVRNKIIEV